MKIGTKSFRVTGPASTKVSQAKATIHTSAGNQAAFSKEVSRRGPSEVFASQEYQDLFRSRLPTLAEPTAQPLVGSRARTIVDAMLDYVHQHDRRPLSLGELAAALKMNASYLSALFSRTTGVTFHHYVEEIRLSKARKLLCDPRNRICEVACASGYASPDAFRHAFKTREGLSPEAWRAGQ